MNRLARMLLALSTLRFPRAWGPFVETAEISHFDHAFDISWSQGGEDLALRHLLKTSDSHGVFVDIGAHHPSRFSVTRHLSQLGWSGVNVDANPDLIQAFDRDRPRDLNIWAAVGDASEYELSIFTEPAISTTRTDWNQLFLAAGETVERVIRVPGRTLRSIFDDLGLDTRVRLLNVDIEGADFEALKSLDLETLGSDRWPEWVVLETQPPIANALKCDGVAYLVEVGYTPYCVLPMATILRSPQKS